MAHNVTRNDVNAKLAADEAYQKEMGRPPMPSSYAGCDMEVGQHDASIRPHDGSIGWAVRQLRAGLKVRRFGWNGKGMWLDLQLPDLHSKMTLPYVYIRTTEGNLVPWLCSQTDLLAWDWEIAVVE